MLASDGILIAILVLLIVFVVYQTWYGSRVIAIIEPPQEAGLGISATRAPVYLSPEQRAMSEHANWGIYKRPSDGYDGAEVEEIPEFNYDDHVLGSVVDKNMIQNHVAWVNEVRPHSGTAAFNQDGVDLGSHVHYVGLHHHGDIPVGDSVPLAQEITHIDGGDGLRDKIHIQNQYALQY